MSIGFKMADDGTKLEQLVKIIEEMLLPQGFNVTTRKKVFDDNGNQIAELDIVVNGVVGSTEFIWLIECRDRPSAGASPVSWIEQLYARRDRLNFNKVTAVSTTGFAPGAVEYAKGKGIELRAVTEVDEYTIFDWLKFVNVQLQHNLGYLKEAKILLAPDATQEHISRLAKQFSKLNFRDPILILANTGENHSIFTVFQNILRNYSYLVFQGILPGDKIENKIIQADFNNSESRYKIVLNDKDEVFVGAIVFVTDLSVESKQIPISRTTEYINVIDDALIAKTIHFESPYKDKNIDFSIHELSDKTRRLSISINPSALKPNDKK